MVDLKLGDRTLPTKYPDQFAASAGMSSIVNERAEGASIDTDIELPPSESSYRTPDALRLHSDIVKEEIFAPIGRSIAGLSRNTFVQEFVYSVLVASVVTSTLRYLLGWYRLFSGYDFLFAFLTSLLVLDLTNRLGGKRNARDYVLALAAAFILLALFHPRPHPIRIP